MTTEALVDEVVVDVWRIDLRRFSLKEESRTRSAGIPSTKVLSEDEAERAARFRFDADRDAFACTRAALRTLVGERLGVAPADVRFTYAPKGKPGAEGVSFNVSHSGDMALIGLTASRRLGVDVELMRPDVEMKTLARRFFSAAENAVLEGLDGDALVRGFYGCWTRKESFVKALGEGLSFDLDRVEVAVPPEPARVVSVDGDPAAGAAWTMADVDAGEGYAGAVVVDAPAAQLQVRDWEPSRMAAL